MRLILQTGQIPFSDIKEGAKWAKGLGVEGIEVGLFGTSLDDVRKIADRLGGVLPILSLCGNLGADGQGAFTFLDADIKKRRNAIDGCAQSLKLCGELGALGQVVPPIFGPPVVPDLSPVIDVLALEDKLMVAAIQELAPIADKAKTRLFLEPLNRYEQHYLRKQSDGIRVIEAAGLKAGGSVALLSDFFHMHIEETSTPHALRDAGKHVGHIHLADNTRMECGTGDIDLVAGFKALVEIGFTGGMACEHGLSVTGQAAQRQAMEKSIAYILDCKAKAGG